MDEMKTVSAQVSTSTVNSSTPVTENEGSTCANGSVTVENESAVTDATCMSTDSAVSASAYEAIQQYSEAELHGEYEAQYFGFTADSVADGRKYDEYSKS